MDPLEDADCTMEIFRHTRAYSVLDQNIWLALWVTRGLKS